MSRFIALLIVAIPGFLAVLGFKLMRDTLFGITQFHIPFLWLQFVIGLLLFLLGLFFVAGFIFHRDKKRKKLQPRFQKEGKIE
ncbi:DUF2627 domain-containing protein [Calidifontibacillus erzurumensis]|uniref:DUF2627 domain-containing protein n=1 Tax=Calidifontibacillus erzurumensis TaxID=2741433 RepID=A0A8J8GB16_9BACI|nr:DUF2627 domain-containing protein [Calidifontibacillus erzurumensis]NSL50402.1 DUF2627 domain-containing protein [Calidifontibacillus erzurumensis]